MILNPEAQENKSAQQSEALKVLEETDAWALGFRGLAGHAAVV